MNLNKTKQYYYFKPFVTMLKTSDDSLRDTVNLRLNIIIIQRRVEIIRLGLVFLY